MRRFELQADCLAGVWIHEQCRMGDVSAISRRFLTVLADIGDDTCSRVSRRRKFVGSDCTERANSARSFLRGAQTGDVKACDTFGVSQP